MRQQAHRPSSIRRHASLRARIGMGFIGLLASFGHVALAADGDPDTTFSATAFSDGIAVSRDHDKRAVRFDSFRPVNNPMQRERRDAGAFMGNAS